MLSASLNKTFPSFNQTKKSNSLSCCGDVLRGCSGQFFNNKYYTLGGIWNCVLNPDVDTDKYVNGNYPKNHNKVLKMIDELDVLDIWRDHNPELCNFTWRRNTRGKHARLDCFYIFDSLNSDVIHSNIQCGYRTDHYMISVTFEFNDKNQHSTYWKFNNSLL